MTPAGLSFRPDLQLLATDGMLKLTARAWSPPRQRRWPRDPTGAAMDSLAELHTFLRDFDAQHSRCPVAKRQLELREERQHKKREAQLQREGQLQSSESWRAWAIAIIDERIDKERSMESRRCGAN